jgi:hypothetical protein
VAGEGEQVTTFSAGLKAAWDYKAPKPWDWQSITEADADYCLEVLPPIYFRGGFAVSEPVIHDESGRPVYLCVREERAHMHGAASRYSAKLSTISDVDARADDWRARE